MVFQELDYVEALGNLHQSPSSPGTPGEVQVLSSVEEGVIPTWQGDTCAETLARVFLRTSHLRDAHLREGYLRSAHLRERHLREGA